MPTEDAPDWKPHFEALSSARTQGDTLVLDIQGHAVKAAADSQTIDAARQHIERTRADADAQIAVLKDTVTEMQTQLASTKTLLTELASLHSAARTTNEQLLEAKASAAAVVQTVQANLQTVTDGANRVEALRAQSEQTAGVIATKSQHIEDGRVHVDEVRAEIDRVFTQANLSATNAEAQHQSAKGSMSELNALHTSAQAARASIDADGAAITQLRQQAEVHTAAAKVLADAADATDVKLKAYEAKISALEAKANERLRTIDSLLPGAASAGLASAFNRRRDHFKWPQRIWQGAFVISILGLLALAAVEFSLHVSGQPPTWTTLALSLLHRLPFALPLIWLAFHSSHRAALAQKVEEDYAFKETVSRSFEGYRREMAELEGKVTPGSALSRLCAGVLGVITNPPGRIYEKHRLNNTPLSAIADSAPSIVDASSKIVPPLVKLTE